MLAGSRPPAARTFGYAALRAAGWLLFIAAALGWWSFLAPASLGGDATYVLVQGTSMEPGIEDGDVVIVTPRENYEVGDVVVFASEESFLVIHRLIDRSANGWSTKGDNRTVEDGWTVPDEAIVGEAWLRVPAGAEALIWTANNSLAASLIAAAVAVLPYLPWRRRRLSAVLRNALTSATREPRRDGRTNAEYAVLWLASLAGLASLWMVTLAWVSESLFSAAGIPSLAAFAGSLLALVLMVYRLYDGWGVAEPSKSMYALAGRLHLVNELPQFDQAESVKSAVALRTIAEKYRLPVLHQVHPVTGRHSFMLITVQEGVFLWSPPSRRMVQEHPLALPADATLATPVSPPVSLPELTSARDS